MINDLQLYSKHRSRMEIGNWFMGHGVPLDWN